MPRSNYLFLLSTIIVCLVSCGSSGDAGAPDPGKPQSENNPTESEGDVPINGAPPGVPIITPLNSRSVAIDVLESGGIIEFAGYSVTNALRNLPLVDANCSAGGRYSITESVEDTVFELAECNLFDDKAVLLSGTIKVTPNLANQENESTAATWAFSNFTASHDGRVVGIVGDLKQLITSDTISLNSENLEINDNQGLITFTKLDTTLNSQNGVIKGRELQHVAVFSRFSSTAFTLSATNLGGANHGCPEQNELTTIASDNTKLTISASGGNSVLITTDDRTDTINCSEISQLVNLR